MTRILTVGLVAASLATVVSAQQFDGPAPLAWRFVQPTSAAPGGAPLVDGSTIYQSIGGRVFSIDKETGNLNWRFPQIDPIEGVFRTSPVLSNGTLVVAGDNKLIYGVNPGNGQLKWSYPTPSPVFGQPAVAGTSLVFATSDNKLHAINVADGTPVWKSPTGEVTPYSVHDGLSGSIGAWQNSVVFFTSRGELISVDITTRKTNWKQRFNQVPPNPQPIVHGDTVFSVSGPYLIAINAVSGLPRWQVNTGLQLAFAPAVSSDSVSVVSQDGKVLSYDATTHEKINKAPIELGTLAVTRPTAAGKMVVIPTTAGGVALVDPAKGAVVWNYLIRPINEASTSASNTGRGPGGAGPGGGGFGPGGGAPGGGFGPGGGGAPGGQANQQDTKVVTIQASAPAAVAGTTLLVPAKDGSLLAFDRTTGVDLTPPSIKMIFPNPGDQVSGQPPLVVAFKVVDDASGIDTSTVKVDIDGQTYENSFSKDGILMVRFSLSGKNRPLSDGRKTITVTAVDWMGNVAKKTFALTIDNTLKPIVLPGSDNDNNAGGLGGGARGGGLGGGGLGGG